MYTFARKVDVTLKCEGCGAAKTYPADSRIDDAPLMIWWLVVRGQRCRTCYVNQLSDPSQPGTKLNREPRDTSRKAARQAMPKSGTQRYRVLGIIASSGHSGCTDEEVRQHMNLYWTSGGADTRRLELEEGGWVQDSGRRRKTRSGKDAIVWVLTDRAITALESHDFPVEVKAST